MLLLLFAPWLLSPQITLCMNVTMRSITQAVLVLVFMLYASWRLTTVTFIMIPFIMALSSVGVGKCGECVGLYASFIVTAVSPAGLTRCGRCERRNGCEKCALSMLSP